MHTNSNPTARPLVALAGGKSGGHVFPALAVAEELLELGARVVLFGMESGMERRLAEERNIPFVAIDAAPLVGRGLAGKAVAVSKLAVNSWRARGLLRQRGAVAVLATGGFVCAPTVLGARLAGIPIVLLEPNADPGTANRLLSRFAEVAAVAFEAAGSSLRCESRVLGVPVRASFAQVAPLSQAAPLTRLLVVGGSQGADRLNAALPSAVAQDLPEASVVHQCGAGHLENTLALWCESLGRECLIRSDETHGVLECGSLRVEVRTFIDDMPQALAAADLVISRAGAITLAELAVAGRGAILIPLPLAGAHQLGNAERQAELGAAVVLEQNKLDRLGTTLGELVASPDRLKAMGDAARRAAKPQAAQDIAALVQETAVAAGRWAA